MSGLDRLNKRMNYYGKTADDRNNKGKLRSMLSAQKNSYQAENITFKKESWRCLINPSKINEDYDKKFISIVFDSGMREGDTFYWDRTGKWWMATLQQRTEEAYFRAEIEICDYQIETENNKYWVYLRGPVETSLNWTSKHNLHVNNLNYTLVLHVIKNEDTLDFFNRFRIMKFDGHNWQVVATDKYSQDNIMQVYLDEYSDNTMEDNMIIPEITKPDSKSKHIEGELFVYPYDNRIYTIENLSGGEWTTSDPHAARIITQDENKCEIEIISGKSMDFNLIYKTEDEEVVQKITINSF